MPDVYVAAGRRQPWEYCTIGSLVIGQLWSVQNADGMSDSEHHRCLVYFMKRVAIWLERMYCFIAFGTSTAWTIKHCTRRLTSYLLKLEIKFVNYDIILFCNPSNYVLFRMCWLCPVHVRPVPLFVNKHFLANFCKFSLWIFLARQNLEQSRVSFADELFCSRQYFELCFADEFLF